MSRRRFEVLAALALCLGLALAGFRLLNVPMRNLEVAVVLAMLGDGHHVSAVAHHTFQVLPAGSLPFRARVTPYCSALVSVLALGAIAGFVLRGPPWRRIAGFVVAATVIVACNVLRITASLLIGVHIGLSGLVLFHDWVGTFFGIAYTMGGFFLMLYVLLPSASDRKLVRAARVSDVL